MGLKNNENNKKSNIGLIFGSVLLIIIFIAGIFFIMNFNKNQEDKNMPYTQLLNSINEGTVEKIEMTEGSDTAKVKLVNQDEEKKVLIPSVDSFIELVQQKSDNGIKIDLIQKERNVFVTIIRTLLSFLPTIILVVLVLMIFKMQGLGKKEKYMIQKHKKQK